MKTHRILAWALPVVSAALLNACGEPPPQCTVGRGDYAVQYTLKSGTGSCAQKKVDIVGAQAFRVPGAGIPPTLYFKPQPLAALVGQDADPTHSALASGDFTTEYPTNGACAVPTMTEARQTASVSGTVTDLRYQWSNLVIQSQAIIPGTQFTADLTYSEGDCTATYTAVGVFPAIKCVAADGTRDPSICAVPRPGSSSLDPSFPIVCEESANLCVLAGTPPALKTP